MSMISMKAFMYVIDSPDCSREPYDPVDYYNPDDHDDHDYCDDHDDGGSLCWQMKMQNHPYPLSHTVYIDS